MRTPKKTKTLADYEGRLVAVRVSDGQITGGILYDDSAEAIYTQPGTIDEVLNGIPTYQAQETAIFELRLVKHLRPRQIPARTEWDEVTSDESEEDSNA